MGRGGDSDTRVVPVIMAIYGGNVMVMINGDCNGGG